MPRANTHKTKGGNHKDSATKNTFNPPSHGQPEDQTQQPYSQDPKRRFGQFEGKGEPPLMKK